MRITTEESNPVSSELDLLTIHQALILINEADSGVPTAVNGVIDKVEEAIKIAVDAIKQGGRMIYVGAGSSGRIGVMDAAEIVPTFDMANKIVGVIAGGDICMSQPNETIEDQGSLGENLIKEKNVTELDFVVGLTASGKSEFILQALKQAKKVNAKTALITVNDTDLEHDVVDVCINPQTGPEVLVGSTRLKATSAMKMILNMISTITMVQLGRTYKNYMCYIKPCNKKLYMRALNIISDCCAIDTNQASKLLEKTENKIPEAIVMQLMGVELAQAEKALRDSGGSVREACRFLEIEKGESEA